MEKKKEQKNRKGIIYWILLTLLIILFLLLLRGCQNREDTKEIIVTDAVSYICKTEYYLESESGDSYQLSKSEEKEYDINSEVTADILEFDCYEFDEENKENILKTIVKENGEYVLKVYYRKTEYKIEYNLNGGTSSDDLSNVVYKVGQSIVLPEVKRTNYSLVGFYDANGNKVENGQEVHYNMTLKALWVSDIYTVYYDGNGGTGNTDAQVFRFNEQNALAYSGYSKAGYVFTGWAKDANGNGHYYGGESVTNLVNRGTGSITLYATWSPISYTVRYHANGGEGTMNDQFCHYDEGFSLNKNTFTKEGYVFNGWSFEESGETVYCDSQKLSNLFSESGKTLNLYAKWAPITYKVIFDDNGKGGNTSEQTFTYDKKKELSVNAFTATGFIFRGWNTESDGSGISYTDKEEVLNLSTVNNDEITLYAMWSDTAILTYATNGGTFSSTPITEYTVGTAVTSLPEVIPGNDYQKFVGWHLKEDCSDDEITSIDSMSEDVTLYAKYANLKFFYNYTDNGETLHIYATPAEDRMERTMYQYWSEARSSSWSNKYAIKKAIFEEEMHPYYLTCAFYDCSNLETIENWENLKVEECISIGCMFHSCRRLKAVDFSGFDTRKNKSLTDLFRNCESITTLDLSNMVTGYSYDFLRMFYGMSSLKELDISGMDTSNALYAENMFGSCSKLEKIIVGEKWNFERVSNSNGMFSGCTSLVGANGTRYSSSKTNKAYAVVDTEETPGYLWLK